MGGPVAFDAYRLARFTERMEACREAFMAGMTPALAAALDECRLFGQAPPEWLCAAVGDLVQERRTPAETLVIRRLELQKAAALRQVEAQLLALARGDDCSAVPDFDLLLGDGESTAVH
jgi:hypothetical protein